MVRMMKWLYRRTNSWHEVLVFHVGELGTKYSFGGAAESGVMTPSRGHHGATEVASWDAVCVSCCMVGRRIHIPERVAGILSLALHAFMMFWWRKVQRFRGQYDGADGKAVGHGLGSVEVDDFDSNCIKSTLSSLIYIFTGGGFREYEFCIWPLRFLYELWQMRQMYIGSWI